MRSVSVVINGRRVKMPWFRAYLRTCQAAVTSKISPNIVAICNSE
jgi:hypothetical protein